MTTRTESEVKIPQAPDAELAILGGLLLEQSVPSSVRLRLGPVQFHVPSSRKIYEAQLALDERGVKLDPVVVAEELRKMGDLDAVGGYAYISTLTDRAIRGELDNKVDLVVEAAQKREYWTLGAELLRKASNGHTPEQLGEIARKGFNWADPATPANAATASRIQVDTALKRIVTAQTILDTDYPEPKWAVKGVIPEGTTIIAGPPKLGKSVFCLNIAVAVAEGGKALSHFDVEQGSVLYLALEDGERRIKERLSRLTDGKLSDRLEVVTRWPRLNEGGLEAIEAWIKSKSDARLLLVDTFKRIRPTRANHHKSANAYDADYDDVVPLTDLTTRSHVALSLVAHTRKLEAEDVLATISGSFGLTGAADGALVLARKRNSRTATLSVIGRDVEEQELALEFTPDNFMWAVLGKADDVRRGGERQEVLDLLTETGELMTPASIAQLLDKTSGAVRALLFKMKGAGEIKLFGYCWRIP